MVNIGKSVVIKGELSGSEDLTIEGHVEGRIELRDNVLTIGPNGKIKAEVFAKAVDRARRSHRQRHRLGEGRHPRQRLGRRRHHLAARGHRRGRALPRQRRHAARRAAKAQPRSRSDRSRPAAPAAPARSQGRQSSPRRRRRSAPSRRSPMADATRSLTDLFGLLRTAPASPTPAPRAGSRLSRTRPSASIPPRRCTKFLASLQAQRRPAAARPRSGRRQQRHVLRRAARLPDPRRGPRRRHRSPRQGRHARSAAGVLRDAVHAGAGHGRRHPLLGRARLPRRPAAQALATALTRAAASRRLPARLLQHRANRARPLYTKYVVVDDAHLRYRTYPARARASAAC